MTIKKVRSVVLQPDQKGLKFYADRRQAKKVFDALIARLSAKGSPYNEARVPQTELPSNMAKGSREHAVFLFTLCLWMRGGVESDTATLLLKQMYEERPDVFNPDMYWNWGPDLTQNHIKQITEVLTKYQLGQRVEENALGWLYNMRKLSRFWQGDPRKLMADKPRFKILIRRIIGETSGKSGEFINEDNPNGFMFFREKMTAMLAYFLMDAKLVEMFYAPVPVDFHVLRLLVSNQIIRVRGKNVRETVGINFLRSSTQRLAREVTEWYCREYGVSPIALCDSLWLLSRTLCRLNPGNSGYVANDRRKLSAQRRKTAKNHQEDLLIEVDFGQNQQESEPAGPTGRKRYMGFKHDADDLLKPSSIHSLEKSCGICPLKDSCRYNIPSAAYYVAGMLLPERLRFIPPAYQVDFLSHSVFEDSFRGRIDPAVRFAEIKMA